VRSLQAISKNYVLDLSHMGILTGILADTDSALTAQLMTAIGEKNLHSLEALCRQGNVTAETQRLLMTLCHLSGPIAEAMPRLLALPLPEASRQAALELDSLCQLLALFGDSNVNLDLSVVNHTDYYNGLIFRGFVDGVASCVLSGGRYDHLLHRMGKSGGAVGFAVYFNELERFFRRPADYDVDTLLVYTPEDDPIQVAKLAQSIAQAGQTVRVQPAGQTDITYKRKLTPDGKEVQ
jgi:ATP phosphoribosyltransferase regulatory subunit